MRRTRKKKKKKKSTKGIFVSRSFVSPLLSDYKSSSLKESFVFIDQKAPQTSPTHSKLRREPRLQWSSGDQSEIGCERTLSGDISPRCSWTVCFCGAKTNGIAQLARSVDELQKQPWENISSRHVTTGKFVSTLFTFDGTSTLWGLSVTSSENGEGRDESW